MSIVTKTGDKGDTGLFGGQRVPKDDPRLDAYGTVDELNSALGLILAEKDLAADVRDQLVTIQHSLFRLGADLATPSDRKTKEERIGLEHVSTIEGWIKTIEANLPPQRSFILPGGSRAGALLHIARTVCRRAERATVTLRRTQDVNEHALIFLNRLSDYLFVLARKVNAEKGVGDVEVQY